MLLSFLTAALWAGTTAAAGDQAPLLASDASAAAAAAAAAAADAPHTFVVTHEAHPHHSLSVTRHPASVTARGEGNRIAAVCPGATDGYTGYLNKGDKHFYFAYFESRSSPKDDPVVMWINGGPGCSSMMGLLMELGPCQIEKGGETARENEESWIDAANIFFLDQPIGVGFSYSDNPDDRANGSFAAAEDVYIFMDLWYQLFPDARQLPFSIAGESYGGHYIPIFANHINEMNKVASPDAQIPLESVLIGNGIFANTVQGPSAYDISCTNATGIGPLLKDEVCARMSEAVPRCELLLKACDEYPDPLICGSAEEFCSRQLESPYVASGRNFYDVSKPCDGPLCYPEVGWITNFLRLDRVRAAFGVVPQTPKFQACSGKVGSSFAAVHDGNIDTRPFVVNLLHSNIRVLIYVGTYDWICNFVGNERVFGSLEWKGLPDFRYQQENNKQVWAGGLWWESGPLRYVRINAAGHMVPFDKPQHALHLFKAWLNKEPLA